MDKKQRILAAALRLFVEQGFHNTSTAAISKVAGVATGTLFLYFPGKEELINSIYKQAKEQLTDAVKSVADTSKNTKDRFRDIWYEIHAWAQNNPEAFHFMQMFGSSPLISNLTKEELAPTMDFAIGLIKQGIKEGTLTKIDPALFISMLNGILVSNVDYLSSRNWKGSKQVIDQSFTIFWKGVSI